MDQWIGRLNEGALAEAVERVFLAYGLFPPDRGPATAEPSPAVEGRLGDIVQSVFGGDLVRGVRDGRLAFPPAFANCKPS